MSITPSLRVHPDCSAVVALALAALRRTGEAAVVVHGVKLLEGAREDPGTIARCVAWMKENEPKHRVVPTVFWDAFRRLDAAAGPTKAAAPVCSVTSGKQAPVVQRCSDDGSSLGRMPSVSAGALDSVAGSEHATTATPHKKGLKRRLCTQ